MWSHELYDHPDDDSLQFSSHQSQEKGKTKTHKGEGNVKRPSKGYSKNETVISCLSNTHGHCLQQVRPTPRERRPFWGVGRRSAPEAIQSLLCRWMMTEVLDAKNREVPPGKG